MEQRFWQSTRGIQLRTGVDNTLIFQFTLNPQYLGRFAYGEGAEVGARDPMAYVLPAFEYRLYDRQPDDGGDYRQAVGVDGLRFHGNALANKLAGTSIDGHPIFEVRVTLPRHAIEHEHNWLMLSPRLEYSTAEGGFAHHALNPNAERLKVTSFEHHFSGPIAHLVTPSSDTLDWDHVQHAIVDAHLNVEGGLQVSSLMNMPTGRRVFQKRSRPPRGRHSKPRLRSRGQSPSGHHAGPRHSGWRSGPLLSPTRDRARSE